jgi:hypothetical protein
MHSLFPFTLRFTGCVRSPLRFNLMRQDSCLRIKNPVPLILWLPCWLLCRDSCWQRRRRLGLWFSDQMSTSTLPCHGEPSYGGWSEIGTVSSAARWYHSKQIGTVRYRRAILAISIDFNGILDNSRLIMHRPCMIGWIITMIFMYTC